MPSHRTFSRALALGLGLALVVPLLAACTAADPTPVNTALAVDGQLPPDPDSALGLPALLGIEPIPQPEFRALDDAELAAITAVRILNADACVASPERRPGTRELCRIDLDFRTLPGDVEVGTVLGAGPTSSTPDGLLVTVTGVSGTTVHATEANLGDALVQGEFLLEEAFGPSDVVATHLVPGVTLDTDPGGGSGGSGRPGGARMPKVGGTLPLSIDDVELVPGVHASGAIELGLTCGAYGGLTWKKVAGRAIYPNGVYFDARCSASETASATLTVGAGTVIEKRYALGSIDLSPIVFMVGPVPVVLVPQLALALTASGEIVAGMSFGGSEHGVITAGIGYHKGFYKVNHQELSFDSHAAVGSGRLTARLGLEASQALLLYGIVGPALVEEVSLSLEGKAPPGKPVWCLRGGLDVGASLDLDLGVKELRWGPESLYTDSIKLACAENEKPSLTLQVAGVVYPGVSGPGAPLFSATATDPEDGALPVHWSSDLDGALGDSSNGAPLAVPGLSIGTHVITATVTDLDGATASKTATVTALSGEPTLTFQVQKGTSLVTTTQLSGPKGSAGYVRAIMTSPVPLLVGSCGAMTWSSPLPVTDRGTGACDFQIDYTQAGTHTLTATVTDPNGKKATATLTVVVTAPPATPSPTLTPITAAKIDGTALPNGGVVGPGDHVVLVVNSNAGSIGAQVRYDWAIQTRTATGPGAWTPLTGSGDSAVGSVREWYVPNQAGVYDYTIRVSLVNQNNGAIVAQSVLAVSYLRPPA